MVQLICPGAVQIQSQVASYVQGTAGEPRHARRRRRPLGFVIDRGKAWARRRGLRSRTTLCLDGAGPLPDLARERVASTFLLGTGSEVCEQPTGPEHRL